MSHWVVDASAAVEILLRTETGERAWAVIESGPSAWGFNSSRAWRAAILGRSKGHRLHYADQVKDAFAWAPPSPDCSRPPERGRRGCRGRAGRLG